MSKIDDRLERAKEENQENHTVEGWRVTYEQDVTQLRTELAIAKKERNLAIIHIKRAKEKTWYKCPCGGQFLGQGYGKKYVHFTCDTCEGILEIPKDKWNKIIHPNLPKTIIHDPKEKQK